MVESGAYIDAVDDNINSFESHSSEPSQWTWGDQWNDLSDLHQQIHKASRVGNAETIKSLLTQCPNPCELLLQLDAWGVTPLHNAQNRATAQVLVEAVAPNKLREFLSITGYYFRWTAFDSAVANHRVDVAEYLCGLAAADQSLLEQNLLFAYKHLCKAKSVNIAKTLVESIPSHQRATLLLHTDENCQTALHVAVSWQLDEVVEYICDLATTQMVNAELLCMKDKWGRTALHLARTTKTVRILMKTAHDKETYVSITNEAGNTAAMRMIESGRIAALEATLRCICNMLGICGIKSALLLTNKKKQNIFHLACISPMMEELYEVLEEYMVHVKLEELFTADVFNNTPFTYLVARYSTSLFAQLILKFPLWQRRTLLLWRNQRQVNCLDISAQRLFRSDFYIKKVLCRNDSTYTMLFHDTCIIHNSNQFTLEHLDSPQKYITYDVDLFRVMKYALNEYSLLDQPMISTHGQMLALAASMHTGISQGSIEVNEHFLLAQSTLKFFHFDTEKMALSEIQTRLYEIDVTEEQSKPKVVVVTCCDSDHVRYASPPGPDFMIITVVSLRSSAHEFSDLLSLIFESVEELLVYLKCKDVVKYININSTMAKHYGRSSLNPADGHLLLGGAKKGKALIICNRRNRDGWGVEYGHACRTMEQLGLQVETLHDKSGADLLAAISEFANSADHGSLTALSIMSHGDTEDNIVGITCDEICSVQEVVDALCLPKMESVTKLVFLSYCRGKLGHKNNRTKASWECTILKNTALLTDYNPIRFCDSQEALDRAREKSFASVDVPVNCYICYSTLPDTKSFRFNSFDDSANKMFHCLSDHVQTIYSCSTSYKQKDKINTDSTAGEQVDADFTEVELTPTFEQMIGPASQLPRVELIPLLIDLTAVVREKSQFTQYLNYCFSVTKKSRPIVLEVLPRNNCFTRRS